jgi:NAD dependent epimerase/dehydratase
MNSLNGAHVFVTGADGFIGSHLVEALVSAGADVRALVYYNSWGQIGWLSDVAPAIRGEVEIFAGDVRDADRMQQGVSGCDYVFHLASLVGIPYSYEAPSSYVATNVVGTLNVLEACRHSGTIKRLVHTSTSEVYGTAQTVPIAETHPLVGQSPYSATKIAADKLGESFFLAYDLPVVIARPFNTYGPRQTARAVIPTIASQLLSGVKELKLGALSPTRDFNFVTDTVAGFLALAVADGVDGAVMNIGSGEEYSIEHTARLLMQAAGRDVPIVCEEDRLRPANSEVNRLIADASRLRQMTGWAPTVDFAEGLRRTAGWIDRNLHHFLMDGYVR